MSDSTPSTIHDYLKQIGTRGGESTKRRGTAYYRAIGRKGAKKRWKQHAQVNQPHA